MQAINALRTEEGMLIFSWSGKRILLKRKHMLDQTEKNIQKYKSEKQARGNSKQTKVNGLEAWMREQESLNMKVGWG